MSMYTVTMWDIKYCTRIALSLTVSILSVSFNNHILRILFNAQNQVAWKQ